MTTRLLHAHTRTYISQLITHTRFTSTNNNQSNYAEDGMAPRFYSLGGSSNLQLHVSAGGGVPPSNTMCHWTVPAKWHLNPSNGLSRVHKCDRRQTDRPRYGEKCSNNRNRLCSNTRYHLIRNKTFAQTNGNIVSAFLLTNQWIYYRALFRFIKCITI